MNIFDDQEKYSDNIALVTESAGQIKYKELLDVADSIGKHINKRCLVFLICNNNFESVAGYLGFMRSKIVPIMGNKTINKTFLKIYLKLINLSMSFCPQKIHG